MKNQCTGRILCTALALGASIVLATGVLAAGKGEVKPAVPSTPAQVKASGRAEVKPTTTDASLKAARAARNSGPRSIIVTGTTPPPAGGIAGCSPPNSNEECTGALDAGTLNPGDSASFDGTALCALPDCAIFTFGEGNLWSRFVLSTTSNVQLQYCGSTTPAGGSWGNAWLNLATGCPCTGFTAAATFAFSCGDGNLELNWANMAPGEYFYPILIDSANNALGTYHIVVNVTEGVPICPNPDHDCSSQGTPGCSDEACCNNVCAADPFCCAVQWDAICVGEAGSICGIFPPPCDPPNANETCDTATDGGVLKPGDCTVFTGTINCAQPDCPDFSIGDGNVWIKFELTTTSNVDLAYCGSAGVWGDAWLNMTNNCPCSGFTSAATFAFSCSDGNVDMNWANLPPGVYYYPVMKDAAFGSVGDYMITVCVTEGVPVCPNNSHDCCTQGTPGCCDEECCNTVCGIDPFCCAVSWDAICVGEAQSFCATPCAPCPCLCIPACPWDNAGAGGLPDGVVGIDDLLGVINHWGACPP